MKTATTSPTAFHVPRPQGPVGAGSRCRAWLAAVGIVAWAVTTAGQEPVSGSRAPVAPPARVGEVGPEIFYLKDESDRLVPVPGFRYRDFVELFRMQQGLPGATQPPEAVLENIVVDVDLSAAGTTCPATVACTVRPMRSGWVHVPLELAGLLLTAAPRGDGPGRMLVDADPVRGGYRVWFDGGADAQDEARHTVTLEGMVPVDRQASSAAVALHLPVATASRVELRTGQTEPEVAVVPAPPPQRITTTVSGTGSLVGIAGLSGAVRIRVGPRGGAIGGGWDAVPQASVESLVRIDGRNAFTEATIRLEHLPPGLTAVRVALPPRTTLRTVREPAAIAARGGTDDAPHADVSIDRDAAGSAIIELECERPIDPAAAKGQEVLGFAVEQVAPWRQWGRVSLVVEGDWRAEWTVPAGIRRVDPPPTARRQGFVAAFAYDSQPASLPVRVLPLRSRVVVEPEYRFEVGATRIGMQARLRIAARGAPVTGISIGIEPGWSIEDVGPVGIVDTTGWTSAGGKIVIPFLQSLSGDAIVEMRGSRPLERTADRLMWKLPMPQADLVAPATVAVAADSDIEILPDNAAMRGLVRQAGSGQPRLDADATTLLYRLDTTEGVFAATRRFLPQRVDASIAAQAAVGEEEIGVEQSIRLSVEHVPLEYVELAVPETVVAGGSLEVRQDDTLLDPLDMGEAPAAAGTAADDSAVRPAVRCLRAILPVPLLGKGEILVRFRVPTPRLPSETTIATELPLVLPVAARIDRQSIVLETGETITVDVRGDAWRREVGPAEKARTWDTSKRLGSVPLAIAARPRVAVGRAVVEAAWLQTHVHIDRREDVFTYVLDAAGEPMTVTVPSPAGVDDEDGGPCEVRLDGLPFAAVRRVDGRFVIDLPPAPPGRRRLLEIRMATTLDRDGWRRFTAVLGLPARVALEPPVFPAGVNQRRFYWDLVARADEHVCLAPARWTAQQRFSAGGMGFDSEPVVSPAALGEWIGAALQPASASRAVPVASDPPLAGRRVVYSGVGPPGSAAIWLIPTWCLVLLASGVSLACGLAFAYRPALRRPGVAVPLLGGVTLAAVAAPDLSPLVAQAAAPGVALSLVAWGLRAFCDRGRGRWEPVPRAAVSASSLTRSLSPPPSLIIAASSPRDEGSITAAGRLDR